MGSSGIEKPKKVKSAKKEAKLAKAAAGAVAALKAETKSPRFSPRLAAAAAAQAAAAVPSMALDAPSKADKEAKALKKAAKAAKAAAAAAAGGAGDADAEKAARKAARKAAKRAALDEELGLPPSKKKKKKAEAEPAEGAAWDPEPDDDAADESLSADAYRTENAIEGSSNLPDPIQSFATSPFDARLKAAIAAAGFKDPSPIQAQSWPVALAGSDLVAIAKTGSGKTSARSPYDPEPFLISPPQR